MPTDEEYLESVLQEMNKLMHELEDKLAILANNGLVPQKGKELVFYNTIGMGLVLDRYTGFTTELQDFTRGLAARLSSAKYYIKPEGNDPNLMNRGNE